MYGIPDRLKALSAAEEQVLLALWDCKPPVSRRDIGARLAEKGWAAATVLNFLYRLEEKGWVTCTKEQNHNLYAPTVTRRAYQKIADVFEQCSYDYDKNSETTKAFYAFVQNKLHYAVTGKTAAELISERATLDSPTMGLTTWKGAPDGKILKSDTLVAKNYLNEKELSRLNRLVTMFIDYAELMAEDEQPMSMQDWLNETDRFLTNNRRKVLDGKGHISREAAAKKVGAIYNEFRKKQDAEYISEFDRQTEKYLKGE